MKKAKKYIISTIFFLLLIIITYLFIIKNYEFNDALKELKHCNPIFISCAFFWVLCYLLLEALFLKRMLHHFGKKVTFYNALGYVFTEIYFSAITPSSMGGQPVQMYEMKKDGIDYDISSVLVLLNTMIYKIVLILLATILFIIYYKTLFSLNSFFNWVVILGYITTILVIILFGILVYFKKITNLLKRIIMFFIQKFVPQKAQNLENKLDLLLKNYQECSEITKKKPQMLLEALLILFGQRLSILIVGYFIYLSFGFTTYNIFLIIAFQICITLGSDLMPTPGGVMINESLLLTVNTILYGETLALGGMLLQRFISFYLLVIISAICYILFHFIKRKKAINL